MRLRNFAVLCMLVLFAPAAGLAQEAAVLQEETVQAGTLQQRLMPESTVKLLTPVESAVTAEENQPAQPAMPRGSGTGLIIAGGALFVAGLLIGGDPGTLLAVTGAAVGAYGLYLYFN